VHEQLEAWRKNEAAAKAKPRLRRSRRSFCHFAKERRRCTERRHNRGLVYFAATDVEGVDAAPTDAQRKVFAEYRDRLSRAGERWDATKQYDLPALNHSLVSAGIKDIHVRAPTKSASASLQKSKDLP